jgi:O-acetyl-ADP-ribose deacetylase (regulator of RNase III)
MAAKITVLVADITTRRVDAIVNAANSRLISGGGVCGAIHRAAGGFELESEAQTRYPEGCPTGQAVETSAYNLPAKYVIHTVGPIWYGGEDGEPELLASAYRSSLLLAENLKCESIAFPNISTGIYGYPIDLAALVVADILANAKDELANIKLIELCAFDGDAAELYRAALIERGILGV